MIKFFLKADPRWDGKLQVKEYYVFKVGTRIDVNGNVVDDQVSSDIVDDGIRKEHAKEYAEFLAVVNADNDLYFEIARENAGSLIDVVELAKAELEPVEASVAESVEVEVADEPVITEGEFDV